jgi:hypothetical protein
MVALRPVGSLPVGQCQNCASLQRAGAKSLGISFVILSGTGKLGQPALEKVEEVKQRNSHE